MAELITHATVGPVLEELRLAFRIRIPEKDLSGTVEAWSRGLTGLTVEAVHTAARRHIQTGDKFPHVKEVRELALDFMARTNGVLAKRVEANPGACPICGATYQHHEITRKKVEIIKHEGGRTEYRELREPMRGKDGQVIYSDGQPVMGPVWETVTSPRQDIYHDRAAHHLAEQFT